MSAEQRLQVLGALRRDDFPLNPNARMRAGVLSATGYRIAGGPDITTEASVAAITELYMAASFLLDRVMDEEVSHDSSIGVETALGTTVLLIAEAALDDAASHLPTKSRINLKLDAHHLLLAACDGQLRELLVSGKPDEVMKIDVDQAMALTEQEAGSLGELAGLIGAGIATGPEAEITSMIRRSYFHFFTYMQVIDDLSDAVNETADGYGSDISKFRPTLPAVFYYRSKAPLGVSPEGGRRSGPGILSSGARAFNPSADDRPLMSFAPQGPRCSPSSQQRYNETARCGSQKRSSTSMAALRHC
ncbi:MAG: polyprenyl synthetase family protein [Chloroflexi bacterium]|nr:polyprenyl synthetase family protein [Chloroflexota bacterium]